MTRPVIGLASLRCGDPTVVRAIARGGGPLYGNDWMHVDCPICGCAMSTCARTPNRICEWCADKSCYCHEGEDQ